MPSGGYVWMGNSGCLLPLLIIFNLFFGKLIFESTGLWLGVESVLVLIFVFKIKLFASRIIQQFETQVYGPASAIRSHETQVRGSVSAGRSHSYKPQGKVVDIQGQIVKDDKQQE
jgi:hypothetical protein